eukprot:TRINITY_DN102620_c0_g1_i1.p1 TRINITY_DN102620_c0_g1~~TRINITY_DN102620_c0_g1_i1.p1  ORF type:complete len:363 (-),score=51.78 TRINITY_DN102620_c0_g1_i1:137-1225(-)
MLATSGAMVLGGAILFQYKRKAGSVEEIPAKMRRLVLREANPDIKLAKLEVEEVDTPKPRSGQVLVKIAAAPVNPSDEGIWKVPPKQGYPIPLGNEGSGKVVASGGGFMASRLLGQNVAFTGQTYAEYAVVDATKAAYSLPTHIEPQDACAFIINPFTVVGIVDRVRQTGGKVFIYTAAASQLGQMLVKYCKTQGVTLINIVRRPEQAEILENLGADYIVDSSNADWKAKLEQLIKELDVKHAFDCISGDMPGTLLTMLPPGGRVWVYGRLSDSPVGGIQPLDLIYRGKKIEGFLLTTWMLEGGMFRALRRTIRTGKLVKSLIQTIFASDFRDTTLADLQKDYCALKASGQTGTKLRLRPHS